MEEYYDEPMEFDEAEYSAEDEEDDEMDFEDAMTSFAEMDDDDDDDDDDGDDGEDEMAEFLPFGGLGLGAGLLASRALRRRKKVRRAKPRRSYARRARGKRYGTVITPAGRARIRLPGRFPTIPEFRRTVAEIQKDIKKNSAGVKDLATSQKRVAALVMRSDKGMEKKVFGLQIAVVALAVLLLPQARSFIGSITS